MSASGAGKNKESGKRVQAITPGVRRATSSSSEKENSGKRIVVHQTSSRISQRVELEKAPGASGESRPQETAVPASANAGPGIGLIFGISFVVIGLIAGGVLLVLKNKASEVPVGPSSGVVSATPSPVATPPAVAPKVVPPLERGLIGHWMFDGDLKDATGAHDEGRKAKPPVYIAGVHGQALRLDGSDPVLIESLSEDFKSLGDHFSYSVWFRAKEGAKQRAWASVLARGKKLYRLAIRDKDAQRFWFTLGVTNADHNMVMRSINDRFPLGQWHHLVVVREGTRAHLYVNGNHLESGSDEALDLDHSVDTPLTIGGNSEQMYPQNNRNIIGDIDDVRVYNRALSFEEAQELSKRP